MDGRRGGPQRFRGRESQDTIANFSYYLRGQRMGTRLSPASRGRLFVAVILAIIAAAAPRLEAQSEIKLVGQVIDRAAGSPVSGVQISIVSLGKYVISDDFGEFRFTDIPAGNYALNAQRIGYIQSVPISVDILSAYPVHVIIPLDMKPIVVPGQTAVQIRSPEINIIAHGNTVVLDCPPGSISSFETVIERVPELELVDSGAQKLLRIRGSQTNAVAIMLDGRIQNSAISSQGDISTIPLNEVSKIEIVKGGDHRTGGLAGTVNFITITDQPNNQIRSAAERGSFGLESYSLGLDQNRPLNFSFDLKNIFTAGNFKFLDPRDSLQIRENNSSRDLSSFGGVSFPLNKIKLDIKARYFKRNSDVPGQVFEPTPLAKSNSVEKEIYSNLNSDLGSGLNLSIVGGLSTRDISFDSPQTPINFIPYKTKFIENARDINLQLQRHRRIDLNASLSWRYQSLDGTDYIRPSSSFGKRSRTVNNIGVGAAIPLYQSSTMLKSVNTNFGLKREDGSGGVFWGPSGGLTINIKSFKFDFSSYLSRRLPDLTDLYWKEDIFATPNLDLLPEKSKGYEFGLGFHSERFGLCDLRASRYLAIYDDIIIWRRWAGDKFKPVNLSKAQIDGWDLSFSFNPLDGPISLFWNADLNRPLNKEASPVHHDKYLTFRPIGTQNGGIELRYHSAEIAFSGRHLGRRYTTEENTKSLPAANIYDLRLSYHINIYSVNLKSDFSILNLGDKQYEILDHQPETPREYRLKLGLSKSGGLI